MPRKPADPVARFWSKVDKSGECWIWIGGRTGSGYGQTWDGTKQVYAHRFAWEQEHGPIPADKDVCHNCPGGDNPLCVRHLWLGTHADNMADRDAKGRTARGQQLPHARLSDADALIIKQRLAAGEVGTRLAHEYGVTKGTISHIRSGHTRTWQHI